MNEDFVTYELAVKLKEKGYLQRTFGEYDMQGACYIEDGRFYENGCITEVARAYTAPTISQALKWLREEKKIFLEIVIVCNGVDAEYMCDIYKINPAIECLDSTGYSKTYELSALAGVNYCLDNLI